MSDLRFPYQGVVAGVVGAIGLTLPSSANAIPAFARQTEQPCATCHVGAFGPQLTDFGREFKLNGYVWGKQDVKPWEHLSAMAYGGLESYGKGKPGITAQSPGGALSTWNSNNNMSLDQLSLFYGGRIYDKIGAFIQATYQDSQRSMHWDNADIRYADTGNIGDHLLLYGVTINNNPTIQDVWQTVPSWMFPYASPVMAPGAPPTPTIWGAFAQHSLGVGTYLELDDAFYLELSGYTGLNQRQSQLVGITGSDTFNRLHGVNPYWRASYHTHDGEQSFELGTYGMDFKIWPGNVSDFVTVQTPESKRASSGAKMRARSFTRACVTTRNRFYRWYATPDAARCAGVDARTDRGAIAC